MLNKILKRIDISKFNLLRFSGFMLSLPEIIIIEPTNFCNFSCLKCQRHHQTSKREMGFLSIENLELILSKIPKTVKFIGINGFGEPLAHPDFPKILEKIRLHKPDIGIGFHTNGTYLNKKIIDACIKCNLDDIEISIDTNKQKTYELIHTSNYPIARLKQNILKLVKARNKSKTKLRIGTSYIIQEENIGQLSDFIKWSHDLGVDFVGPIKTINPLWGYDLKKWKLPYEHIRSELIKAKALSKKLEFPVQYPNINEVKAGSANIDPLKNFSCAFPFNLYPIITWDGFVLPCVWIQDLRYSCGNILNNSFYSIWNGTKIRRIRRIFAHNKYLKICKNCQPLRKSASL